jgi:Bacteriophytochrome (light-regulated signal transduction histidine kinase)
LGPLLNEVLLTLEDKIKSTHATITVTKLPTYLYGYRIKLQQLFQNIISNSLKFSRKDVPVKIEIGYTEITGFWEFYIKDNGIGIAPEHHNTIFNMFRKLHRREEYEGTGIGLAICKKIVEQHSGKIWVKSKLGEYSHSTSP